MISLAKTNTENITVTANYYAVVVINGETGYVKSAINNMDICNTVKSFSASTSDTFQTYSTVTLAGYECPAQSGNLSSSNGLSPGGNCNGNDISLNTIVYDLTTNSTYALANLRTTVSESYVAHYLYVAGTLLGYRE